MNKYYEKIFSFNSYEEYAKYFVSNFKDVMNFEGIMSHASLYTKDSWETGKAIWDAYSGA